MSTMTQRPPQQVMVGYDGSPAAKLALDVAAGLTPQAHLLVVHVYEPVPAWIAMGPAIGAAPPTAHEGDVEMLERRARELADEGLAHVRSHGVQASAEIAEGAGATGVWSTIVQLARERDVDLIVVGTRRRSAIAAVVLGSVSNGVVHHADRPVLVVPGPHEA